jgi:hypothetical protein
MERRLAPIFAADVEAYSRYMGEDEAGTFETLIAHRAILDSFIAEHRGRIANTAGDSVLAEFPSAVDAVTCALRAQEALSSANDKLPETRRLEFRIGVHVGDIMVKGGDLFGDGVNIAARAQALARPGGVCVSGVAQEHVRKTLPVAFRLNPRHPQLYGGFLSRILFLLGRYGEIVKRLEFRMRDTPIQHRRDMAWLAAAYGLIGRSDLAEQCAAWLVEGLGQAWRGDPNAGSREYVEWLVDNFYLRRPEGEELVREGLRRAGLPA